MSELLARWLQEDVGLEVGSFEQDFANGFMFGQLFKAFNLQPDVDKFVNKGKPDSYLNNYKRLQPTFSKLGIKMDNRTVTALMNQEAGLAGKLVYSVKQAVSSMSRDLQAMHYSSKASQQLSAPLSPSKGLLETQKYKSQRDVYESSNIKFFEDVMRSRSSNPNTLMQSMHLKRFADEGAAQAAAAAEALAQERAAKKAAQGSFRQDVRNVMETTHSERVAKLQRDEAVHAALLKHKEELERGELRVELTLTEKARHRRLDERAAAGADAAAGIDAFEMTLKRLGGDAEGEDGSAAAAAAGAAGAAGAGALHLGGTGELGAGMSPMDTLGRIRALAPATVKLGEEAGEYLATIKARRREEVATRVEREARRRRLLVEQQAAREASERKAASDNLLELLAKRSGEEQKLAQRLWQLGQEREVMKANRALREQRYAERRERDWEETLQREAALHRSLKEQYDTTASLEMQTWRSAQEQRRAAKAAAHATMCKEMAWQLVMIAERAVEHRAATGQPVARKDWRDWLAMFKAGDPALGTPVLSDQPSSDPATTTTLNEAAVSEYLACEGEWASLQVEAPVADVALGRAVAELAVQSQVAAEKEQLPQLSDLPLRLSVVGAPFSGKSTVCQALAKQFCLKLLTPDGMVADAVQAAEAHEAAVHAYDTPQDTAEGAESAAESSPPSTRPQSGAAPQPSEKAVLGAQLQQLLRAGEAVPDALLVPLAVLNMHEARTYQPPPANPSTADGKGAAKASKPAAATGKAQAGGKGSSDSSSTSRPTKCQGFVLDGFPATEAQAVALERALTGLNLDSEALLMQNASQLAPPPEGVLPQLQRPLVSGLDAVLMLSLGDEGAAVKRALGRRLDPNTGKVYHVEFDPPPADTPGLVERLRAVQGDSNEASQIQRRLTQHEAEGTALAAWVGRFMRLQRPVDGGEPLAAVLGSVSDAVAAILRAKTASLSARSAAEAAGKAKESAERAREFAGLAQEHAEAAARELLAAKRAEIQATALLAGGKNPDPAATEVLKAQSAAKCAEQLKVCKGAAQDAAGYAERAMSASTAAAEAVLRARRAVGDADASAEAETAAKRSADEAESASKGAADAARKSELAKQAAEAFVAEADKWAGAADVPADASVRPLSALLPDVASEQAAGSPEAVAAAAVAAAAAAGAQPVKLPVALAAAMHEEWRLLEGSYLEGLGLAFGALREQRGSMLQHLAGLQQGFRAFLRRGDCKQQLLSAWLERFNAVDVDMRRAKETQGELLLRCEELRDVLWEVCDKKAEEAEADRSRLANDTVVVDTVGLASQQYAAAVQVELDRFVATSQFLQSHSHARYGLYTPPEQPLCTLPTDVAAGVVPPELKERLEGKGAPPSPTFITAVQAKMPQLATALRLALTISSATTANAKAVSSSAAAASATATAAIATAKAAAAAAAAPASAPAGKGAAAASKGKAAAAGAAEAANAAAAGALAASQAPGLAALEAATAEVDAGVEKAAAELQQRLQLLAASAGAAVEEAVAAQGAVNARLSAWLRERYQAECSAVAALERVTRAAAAEGAALPYDLRLEDEDLVIDESQLLLPPPRAATRAPARAPPPPAGLMSPQQLQALVAALSSVAPEGLLRVADTVDLMMRLAAQGTLPSTWRDIDATHMLAAVQCFDQASSDYIDWRELVVCLAGAATPALHTATPSQLVQQLQALAAADSDQDGCLTQVEWCGARFWFEPKPERADAAEEGGDVEEAAKAREAVQQLKEALWHVFSSTKHPGGTAADGVAAAVVVCAAAPAEAAIAAAAGTAADGTAAAGSPAALLDYTAALLYLCADRDQHAGIKKALAVATGDASPAVRASAEHVFRLCYPLGPEAGAPLQRSPVSMEAVCSAVRVAHEARLGRESGGGAAVGGSPTVRAEQVMYGAQFQSMVALLMGRYQWQDVYIAARQ